jgi:hypothetical protein
MKMGMVILLAWIAMTRWTAVARAKTVNEKKPAYHRLAFLIIFY